MAIKIMLVEDDNNLRALYGERLMAEGYDIVSARDGEEALAMAVKEKPQLVISDVMMPKISGFDMLDILRSTPETKDVKVIMMTALSQVEDKDRADKLGANKYLVKSQVTLEDVVRVVHEVLGDGEQASEPAPTAPSMPEPTTVVAAAQPIAATSPTNGLSAPTEPVTSSAPANGEPVVAQPAPAVPTTAIPEPVVAPLPVPQPLPPLPPAPPLQAPTQPPTPVADPTPMPPSQPTPVLPNLPDPTPQPAVYAGATSQTTSFVPAAPVSAPAAPTPPQPSPVPTPPAPPSNEPTTAADGLAPSAKKVIQPLNPDLGQDGTPKIYALYEKEMAEQARMTGVVQPTAGTTLEGAVEPSAATPVAPEPELDLASLNQPVDAAMAPAAAPEQPAAPDPLDPNSVAL